MKLNGEMVYLWRALDGESEVLDSYVTKIREKAAALTFMTKVLSATVAGGDHRWPSLLSGSDERARQAERHEVGSWANNRVESSHLPFRRRERAMLHSRQMRDVTEVRLRPRLPS